MASEIAGAVAGIRLLMDLIKANKTLANYNELVAAVSEVNADLLSAQATALASQKNEMALTQRIRELEEKISKLENWEREAERYQLHAVTGGTFTYCVKPGMEQGEPTHYLCTNCFADNKKSILQFSAGEYSADANCPRCKSKIPIDPENIGRYFLDLLNE